MDYEKKYKEALATAKDCLKDGTITSTAIDYISTIFPELKESEDERIRKELIRETKGSEERLFEIVTNDEFVSWLEKQGTSTKLSEEEQNSFSKGVLSNCALSFINYLDAHSYEGKMCVSNGECEDIDYAFHNAMWDRLHRYYCKYIEEQGEQKPILDFKASNFYVSKVDGKIHDITYNSADKVEPIFSIGDVLCDKSCTTLNKKYQPIIEILDIRNGMYICNNCSFPISQQDEYELVTKKNEPQYAWSDEDESIAESIEGALEGYEGMVSEDWEKEKDWLKSLKNKIQPQIKEWSDEDDYNLQCIIDKVNYDIQKGNVGRNNELIDWLKSLKDRATWKPSEEQMEALDDALNERGFDYNYLNSLYEQLKKL